MTSLRRQIVGYLPATVVPALMSFASVYVFTRLLPASEYGRYNIALSGILVAQAGCFFALQVAFLRLFPAAERDGSTQRFVKSLYAAFFAVLAVASFLFLVVYVGVPARSWGVAVSLLTLCAFVLRSTVMFNQTANRAASRMKRLNLIECLNATVAFGAGTAFALGVAANAQAPLAGLALGAACSLLADRRALAVVRTAARVDQDLLRDIGRFASPLALSFLVSSLLQNGDRFLLGSLNGAAAVGIYAVAVTLVDRPITLICSAIHTATFPLMTQSLEQVGAEVASAQMVRSGTLLMALTAPACVGLGCISTTMAAVMVGPAFGVGVIALLPIVSCAAFLRAVAQHFLEHAFHLSKRSGQLLAIYVPVTILSLVANYLLVPKFGVSAAAWVAVGAQGLLAGLVLVIGRSGFAFAFPYLEVVKIGVACTTMALAITHVRFATTWSGLFAASAVGALVYAVCALGLNVGGVRDGALARILPAATSP